MTACIHGHELTPENIVIRHGRERCRTCEREHGRRYREKKRAVTPDEHDAALASAITGSSEDYSYLDGDE